VWEGGWDIVGEMFSSVEMGYQLDFNWISMCGSSGLSTGLSTGNHGLSQGMSHEEGSGLGIGGIKHFQ
jgi:hypothetical protein